MAAAFLFLYIGHMISDALLFYSIKADNTQTNERNYVSTRLYLQKQAMDQIQQTGHSLPMPILDNRKKGENLVN